MIAFKFVVVLLSFYVCHGRKQHRHAFIAKFHQSRSSRTQIVQQRKTVAEKLKMVPDKNDQQTFDWVKNNDLITKRTVKLTKPMGIILEEIDESNSEAGVVIKDIDPMGNAAAASRRGDADICIRDKILAVNNEDVEFKTFENIMDLIRSSEGSNISVTLGRCPGSIALRWPNGVGVAAQPGEHFCDLALLAKFRIPYSCTSGGCGTCEQSIINDTGNQRYVRPCVARVPKGAEFLTVEP